MGFRKYQSVEKVEAVKAEDIVREQTDDKNVAKPKLANIKPQS